MSNNRRTLPQQTMVVSGFLLFNLLSIFTATLSVPAEYQCKPLNSTLSYECPNVLGPPDCPPCYTNFLADYDESTDSLSLSDSTISSIIFEINKNIQFWLEIYSPYSSGIGYSIIDGFAGISLMFLRLYHAGFDQYLAYSSSSMPSDSLTTLQIADLYINKALSKLPSIETTLSYYTGHIGVWSVAFNIEFVKNNQTGVDYYISLIQDSYEQLNTLIIQDINNTNKDKGNMDIMSKFKKRTPHATILESGVESGDDHQRSKSKSSSFIVSKYALEDCTLFYGLAGALYNALELNYFYANNTKKDVYIINDYIISNITYYILKQGIELGLSRNHSYLEYSNSNGCLCIGQDNGSGGIIKILLMAAKNNKYLQKLLFTDSKYANDEFRLLFQDYVTNTLNYLMSRQLIDGNMPTSIGQNYSSDGYGDCSQYGNNINDSDSRVQWDHGGPGFISLFSYAADIYYQFNINSSIINEDLIESALRAYNTTWERGLLVKGLMYCHGIGGNIYMMQEIYHNLGGYKNKNSKYYNNLSFLRKQSIWRSKQFIEWTLDGNNYRHLRFPCDVPFSMYQGTFGIPVLYSKLLDKAWPDVQSCQPGYMLCSDFV